MMPESDKQPKGGIYYRSLKSKQQQGSPNQRPSGISEHQPRAHSSPQSPGNHRNRSPRLSRRTAELKPRASEDSFSLTGPSHFPLSNSSSSDLRNIQQPSTKLEEKEEEESTTLLSQDDNPRPPLSSSHHADDEGKGLEIGSSSSSSSSSVYLWDRGEESTEPVPHHLTPPEHELYLESGYHQKEKLFIKRADKDRYFGITLEEHTMYEGDSEGRPYHENFQDSLKVLNSMEEGPEKKLKTIELLLHFKSQNKQIDRTIYSYLYGGIEAEGLVTMINLDILEEFKKRNPRVKFTGVDPQKEQSMVATLSTLAEDGIVSGVLDLLDSPSLIFESAHPVHQEKVTSAEFYFIWQAINQDFFAPDTSVKGKVTWRKVTPRLNKNVFFYQGGRLISDPTEIGEAKSYQHSIEKIQKTKKEFRQKIRIIGSLEEDNSLRGQASDFIHPSPSSSTSDDVRHIGPSSRWSSPSPRK